jgi:hypothetical protein
LRAQQARGAVEGNKGQGPDDQCDAEPAAVAAPEHLQADSHHGDVDHAPADRHGALRRHHSGGLVACRRGVGPEYFEWVNGVFGSFLGRLVLFGYTWALVHHLLGGIRHFIWDTGHGFDPQTSTKMAWATITGSVILTVLIWIAGYATRF